MTLINIFEQYGVRYRQHGEHHHTTRNWINVDCPWCSPGWNKYRLGFHPTGRCSCWQCGRRDPITAVAKLCSLDYGQAAKLLKSATPQLEPITEGCKGIYQPPKGVDVLLKPFRSYLTKRGFDPDEIVDRWGVGCINPGRYRLQWRLFIPIHDVRGRPVSWTTRSIGDKTKPKYISASPEQEDVPHKHLLYGEQHAQQSIVIVEGPFDVWAIGPGAVATFGVAVTHEQIDRIVQYPRRYVCFDRDAQDQAYRLCMKLTEYPGVTIPIELESGGDPASAHCSEIAEIRAEIWP